MNNRPLSPHLQIWKWGPHMAISILHRATGDALAVAGLFTLLWWLGALASGPQYYGQFVEWMTSPWGYALMIGLSWSFFNHMLSGLRHFVLDIGAGYELNTNRFWSIASPVLAIILTAGFWALIFTK